MAGQEFSRERRGFLRSAAVSAGVAAAAAAGFSPGAVLALAGGPPLSALSAVRVANPLASYPDRGWERTYRNLEAPDSDFVFLCAPNDTHNCLLRAYVKNGVIVRIGPTYGYGKARDIYGNQASERWDPRLCQKGLTLMRRIHGNRRVTRPLVRQGFRRWVEDGFPRGANGLPPAEYLHRGQEPFEALPWDEAFDLAARALTNIAQTYSGAAGAALLATQGYDPEVVATVAGAGTRTLKFRGGMPFLGATRIIGMYRYANSMALLDAFVRGTDATTALGGRGWDNYAWHTDLPPGHTLVTGQQTIDFDLALAERADLITLWGMNWIATKMPDGHWLTEARLKGTKVIVIACEYQATANKADELILIRPATDSALALGVAQVLMRDDLVDHEFVKQWTDLPLLVRTDTRQLLRAGDVFAGYTPAPLSRTQLLQPGQAGPPPDEQTKQVVPQEMRDRWGDYVVWDTGGAGPAAVSRDDVGSYLPAKGLDPALDGTYAVPLAAGGTVEARPLYAVLKEHLAASYAPADVAAITGATAQTVEEFAAEVAAHPRKTFFITGMGPNHFFNNDL
ncbi:MAG TPA: molybdopterin-dependent oxidoreductase, partial [Candidatus Thermoplasmatota archaeon]